MEAANGHQGVRVGSRRWGAPYGRIVRARVGLSSSGELWTTYGWRVTASCIRSFTPDLDARGVLPSKCIMQFLSKVFKKRNTTQGN